MQYSKLKRDSLFSGKTVKVGETAQFVIRRLTKPDPDCRFDVREVRMPRLLVVEDSPAMLHMYREYLSKEPYDITVAETLKAAAEAIRTEALDLILLDIHLPDGNGLSILDKLSDEKSDIKTIVMTAQGSVNVAVDAMRKGAYDFVVKPFTQERIIRTLHNALEVRSLRKQVEEFQKTERPKYHSIVGSSLPMQTVYRTIDAAAPTDATVFVTGETGTGKELVAQSIHAQSNRRNKNCVVLNCAAIPKDLMESEIFGHVKGAFTGATDNRYGAAHLAHKGTLFLDELGEMDLALQSKLLRFLQSGTFNRVGSNKVEEVDIRIVCATNRDPWQEVQKGTFREDLYYRLNVIPLPLPALRERGRDIIEIAEKFMLQVSSEVGKEFTSLSNEVKHLFHTYYWPGNIRQLQNVVRNIVVLNQGPIITMDMVPPLEVRQNEGATSSTVSLGNSSTGLSSRASSSGSVSLNSNVSAETFSDSTSGELLPMWKVEQMMIDRALEKCGNNVNKAATMLEISPSSIYRKRSA